MAFTLGGPCEYREEIRKSRFLALAAPVSSAAEAQAFIARHSDLAASHNCWAWKVGNQYRFNDDGEPGGTAGRPILAAIEGQDLDQVAVLVIRWYGGIQLGTGCHLLFAELPVFKARLSELDVLLDDERYDATGARLQLAVATPALEPLQRLLSDLSRGREQLQRL